jgi:hypothetical protein
LSRRIDKHWRLIGWATIKKGTALEPVAWIGMTNEAEREQN